LLNYKNPDALRNQFSKFRKNAPIWSKYGIYYIPIYAISLYDTHTILLNFFMLKTFLYWPIAL
jgi:hypothetical protein